MRVKVPQGREEINSIGGISLVDGLIKWLKSLENTKNGSIKAEKTKEMESGI